MTSEDIIINPDFSTRLFHVGEEKTCVIVCDDVVQDMAVVRRVALTSARFQIESKTAYPGRRALLPRAYAAAVFPILESLIREFYSVPKSRQARINAGFFSLVTLAPEDLAVQQCLPHFDSTSENYFAVMQYVNDGEFGGTSFYGHRPTGYENITADRKDEFVQSAQSFIGRSPPQQDYFGDSDDHFVRLGTIRHKANRFLIYPGTLLHSGNIRSDADICADPATGRLTTNLFIEFPK